MLTGCVKYDLSMSVSIDKSFELSLIEAIVKDYASMSQEIFEAKSEYEKMGYTVEEYSDDEYLGLRLKKNYTSIDQISSSDVGTVELTNLLNKKTTDLRIFNSKKIGSVTTYIANLTYDLTIDNNYKYSENIPQSDEVDYSEYADMMIFKYTINIPDNFELVSNNADEIKANGHTLTWNIKYGELTKINFTFKIDDKKVTKKVEKTINEDEDNDKDQLEDEKLDNNISNDEKKEEPVKSYSYIFSFLILIAIFIGIFFIKSKLHLKPRTSSKNGQIYHDVAPRDMKNKF